MSAIGQRESRNDSNDVLREAEAGETFVVTRLCRNYNLSMATPSSTLERLHHDAASGDLGRACAQVEVDLLVLFGSARVNPKQAHDVDLAYSFRSGKGDELAVVNMLGARYGDSLDLMPLDRAGSVARWAALSEGEMLVELTPSKFAVQSMLAFGMYCDTQWLRDRALVELQR